MDGSRQDIALQRKDLRQISNQLHDTRDSLKELEIEAGRLSAEMVARGEPQSEIAVRLGVSKPHVKTLMARAEEQYRAEPAADLIPLLSSREVLEYLADSGRVPHRVISGFSEADVLYYSGLSPELFDPHAEIGTRVEVPNMLLLLDSGRWLGVEGANVGYGGTGPNNSYNLLRGIGVEEELAYRAYSCRFVDLELINGSHLEPKDRELYGLSLPVNQGQMYAVHLCVEDLRESVYREDEEKWVARTMNYHEAPSVVAGETAYERFIDFLDGEQGLPDWLSGPRVGRLFISAQTALDHGFGRSNRKRKLRDYNGPVYRLIVEQGNLQLWLPFYEPMDKTQALPREAYAALSYGSLYPPEIADLKEKDEGSRLGRYLERAVGRRQPDYVDISREGNRTISYIPAQEPTGSR